MKFGLCHLVVIDDDNSFKSVFTAIYDCLAINYEIVAKCDRKVISVEQ